MLVVERVQTRFANFDRPYCMLSRHERVKSTACGVQIRQRVYKLLVANILPNVRPLHSLDANFVVALITRHSKAVHFCS